jgi:FkbM family methyltransferase
VSTCLDPLQQTPESADGTVMALTPGRFNPRWIVRAVIILGAAYFIYANLPGTIMVAYALGVKARGGAPDCSWRRAATVFLDGMTMVERRAAIQSKLVKKDQDPRLDLELFQPQGERAFWIKTKGSAMNGETLLAYLLSEQEWDVALVEKKHVRPGDIVLDCGAHIGTFTNKALERGAAKVVGFEPDPVNAEAFRRNFKKEIAEGRVILIEQGVWDSKGEMTLTIGTTNSGTNSMVLNLPSHSTIQVGVDTIDAFVNRLNLPRVDFIKMDIEGAERQALKGASGILSKYHPRLMIDSYHRPDDMQVLPQIIHQAWSGYMLMCGGCEVEEGHMKPHVTFYE